LDGNQRAVSRKDFEPFAYHASFCGHEYAKAFRFYGYKKGAGPILSPDAALERLLAGNARYAGNTPARPHQDALRRAEVATSQNPFAVVVGCSDSRVPVEVIYDVGVGDLFVVRTAGNLIEDVCIASVEYAIAVLDVPLAVIMGHRRCGAVTSAVAATLEEEKGNIVPVELDLDPSRPRSYVDGLVTKIRPAVDRVLHAPGDLIDNAVRSNVELMVRRLYKRSVIVHDAVSTGKVKVVGAVYDLDTGLVNVY
jgi:carbonic anhydrase